MSGLNKVLLIGRATNKPKIITTKTGKKMASFSIATNEYWLNKAKNEKEKVVEFHRIVVFNDGLARTIEAYVEKGREVYIEGSLRTREYTDNNGIKKYVTEVVLSGFNSNLVMLSGVVKKATTEGDSGQYNKLNSINEINTANQESTAPQQNNQVDYINQGEEEIPF